MPLYEFKCPTCGVFEEQHPMSSIPRTTACHSCGADARKIMSSTKLSHLNSARGQALSSAEASAHEPQVVTSMPGTRGRPTPITTNPLHAKLPRP